MRAPPTTSYAAYVAVYLGLLVAYGLCIEPARTGHQHLTGGAVVGALVAGGFVLRARDDDFWRLTRPRRRVALAVTASGRPSWDPAVDLVALGLLTRAGTRRRRWVGAVVLTAVSTGLPVVAAVRTADPWYLLALAAVAWPAATAVREARREDPQVRLARLRAATGEGPPVEVSPAGTGR